MNPSDGMIPLSFDLSSLVQRSEATLYSHLVTRPTGRALRLGIESQIGDFASHSLSILDFTQVVVLDYSCADEAIAKLIQRFQRDDRPVDTFFLARGVGEQHRDPIEAVLGRHDLALAAEVTGGGFVLLGNVTPFERKVWDGLQRVTWGSAHAVADEIGAAPGEVEPALDRLAGRRTVFRREHAPPRYYALSALLADEHRHG